MRVRHLLLASMMVLGLVAATAPANAAVIDISIAVSVNTVAAGTATSSSGILDVGVNVGDTVRFVVGIAAPASSNISSYASTITADDPTEIDYTVGSGVELSGLNFAALSDPDAQLNDGTPGVGNVNSASGSKAATDFYRVDYVVQAGLNSDSGVDFSVLLIFATTGFTDTASPTAAQVRLNSAAPPVPEPASMLLLGSGLAGLAGFGRKKFRK